MEGIGKGRGGSLIKGIVRTVTLLLAVSLLAFIMVNGSGIDPVQQYIQGLGTAVSPEKRVQIEEYWGVNEPPVTRYLGWLGQILKGNMGESSYFRRPVAELLLERFQNSLALMTASWALSGGIGFVLGCVMGIYRNRWPDRMLKKLCYLVTCIPTFWIGMVFLLVFSVYLGWFPIGFSAPIGVIGAEITFWQKLYHLILPALTLSMLSFAQIALHTRQKLMDVFDSDYVLFARARGESERTILFRHGIRNTLLPALTLQFTSFSELFGGSVIAENVFSYPGLGSAVTAAGLNGDVPLLLGITLVSALFVSVGNRMADLLYGLVDPRIREVER